MDKNEKLLQVLHSILSDAFDSPVIDKPIKEEIADLARVRIAQALKKSGGNKSKAAKILGLPNYQTLTNWMIKYNVKESIDD